MGTWGKDVARPPGEVVGAVPTTRPATLVVRIMLYLIVKRVLLLKRRQETNVCSIISHPFPEAVQFFFGYRYSFDVTPTGLRAFASNACHTGTEQFGALLQLSAEHRVTPRGTKAFDE